MATPASVNDLIISALAFATPSIGSNGKTTVKEMIATILAVNSQVLFTQGNFNNDIGVPLTLLRLNQQHQYAVIEMGANHRGEIAYTSHYARPDVSVINNVGPAHIEGFGSIEGVASRYFR
jgi:UDP-N-acetylmuramoyl-tripeptide--D-alanyl-D-alanine ligase